MTKGNRPTGQNTYTTKNQATSANSGFKAESSTILVESQSSSGKIVTLKVPLSEMFKSLGVTYKDANGNPVQGIGGGGSADGVFTGASLTGTTLRLTRSTGLPDITVNLGGIAPANNITGSGNTNTLPLFKGANEVGDSIITQLGTTGVVVKGTVQIDGNTTLGTSFTNASLTVNGDVSVANLLFVTGELMVDTSAVTLTSLPTTDPGIQGALWNDSGTVKVSL